MAESELAVLSAQCLNRRIADRQTLEQEVAAWLSRRNANYAKADGIAPRPVELCEASAAVNDVKRPSRFVQQRGCLFPFRSEQQARLVRPEVA
jgi:hypothetical protein